MSELSIRKLNALLRAAAQLSRQVGAPPVLKAVLDNLAKEALVTVTGHPGVVAIAAGTDEQWEVGHSGALWRWEASALKGLFTEFISEDRQYKVLNNALDAGRFALPNVGTSLFVRFQSNHRPDGVFVDGAVWIGFTITTTLTESIVNDCRRIVAELSTWFAESSDLIEMCQSFENERRALAQRKQELVWLAHDIRSPLASIHYLLHRNPPYHGNERRLEDQFHSTITPIDRELTYLNRLVNDFGSQARDQIEVESNCDLTAVIRNFVERTMARGKQDFSLCVSGDPSPLYIPLSATTVERILENIVGNAERHSGSKKVEIAVWCEFGEVNCEVRDEGCGLTPEVVSRIQEGTSGCLPSKNGWGIGFSSVRLLIERVRGRVVINSTIGRGTSIRLIVPLLTSLESRRSNQHPSMMDETPTIQKDTPSTGHDLVVLIVDDEPEQLHSLTRVLSSLGVPCRGLESVQEVLDFPMTYVSAIVCDVDMPDGGARTLCQRLKATNCTVPISVLSGNLSIENQYDFASLGVRECFEKPARIEDLVRWIRSN